MRLSEKNIWIFGAGGACTWILSGFKRERITVKGILDDKPNPVNDFFGLSVYESSLFDSDEDKKENDAIVVSILNANVDIEKIINRLKNKGWKTVLEYGEFVEQYSKETKKVISPIDSTSWVSRKKELKLVKNILSDDTSTKVLESFVKFVEKGTNSFLPISKNQYFPKDLKRWNGNLNFIDCGAFDGDTLLELDRQGYHAKSIHAFEPDMFNYKKLIQITKKIQNVHVWPCGVGNSNESIRFQTQDNMGSYVDPNGNSVIQCVRLDDCLPNYNANFIKMDIEGHEYFALLGAENILKTYLPGLAISVYHLPDDIWQIALYLKEIYHDKAKFYLRNHSRTIADTILYVVPN